MEERNDREEQSLFADEMDGLQYEMASVGQRFLNYLVDNLLMQFALSYLTGTLVGMLLQALAPDFLNNIDLSDPLSTDALLLTYAITIFNYLSYYTFCERIFNGRSVGKFVTGTMVIRNDGLPLTWKDTFLRSLCRLVPFEPFSTFGGTPWHDTWTKTTVVKNR